MHRILMEQIVTILTTNMSEPSWLRGIIINSHRNAVNGHSENHYAQNINYTEDKQKFQPGSEKIGLLWAHDY